MPVRVPFVGFGESSLNLEVMAWRVESDWDRFLELRHEVLLKIMRIIEDHGAKIAFPNPHAAHGAAGKP